MKEFFKTLYFNFRKKIGSGNNRQKDILVLVKDNSQETINKFKELEKRLHFYDPEVKLIKTLKLSKLDYINDNIIVYFGFTPPRFLLKSKVNLIFDLDYDTNFDEGWEYHRILKLFDSNNESETNECAALKLASIKDELKSKFDKAYIFGTGPSLEKASERNWNDGVRIVSNTIVKDKELWNHINPHFIVAGDAIYHYGFTSFAKNFRKDLADRLGETSTFFVFQDMYYPFVRREFPDFLDRLIPIPARFDANFFNSIENAFELPVLGNVLNGLLLPLACYFSKNVYLWGFDGRSPNDKLFWKNSDKHFYSDMVPDLQNAHPAFFNRLVPKDNPGQYVQSVHGESLDIMLKEAEQKGYTFTMLHKSFTETLNKRFNDTNSNN